jgi:hypothetical protein
MELFKPAGEAVELWGEGHGFLHGASRLTDRAHCPSTRQSFEYFIPAVAARTGELWKPS